jgi:trigger factor
MMDDIKMEFPEAFLKKWLMVSGDKPKTAEEVENEFPTFKNQLRWTLITDRIIHENHLEATDAEIKDNIKAQVLSYFGNMGLGSGNIEWIDSYVDSLMKDEQQVDGAYRKVVTEKVFTWAEHQVQKDEKKISADEFIKMNEAHQHEHH